MVCWFLVGFLYVWWGFLKTSQGTLKYLGLLSMTVLCGTGRWGTCLMQLFHADSFLPPLQTRNWGCCYSQPGAVQLPERLSPGSQVLLLFAYHGGDQALGSSWKGINVLASYCLFVFSLLWQGRFHLFCFRAEHTLKSKQKTTENKPSYSPSQPIPNSSTFPLILRHSGSQNKLMKLVREMHFLSFGLFS